MNKELTQYKRVRMQCVTEPGMRERNGLAA